MFIYIGHLCHCLVIKRLAFLQREWFLAFLQREWFLAFLQSNGEMGKLKPNFSLKEAYLLRQPVVLFSRVSMLPIYTTRCTTEDRNPCQSRKQIIQASKQTGQGKNLGTKDRIKQNVAILHRGGLGTKVKLTGSNWKESQTGRYTV